jgi:hypothetical protein
VPATPTERYTHLFGAFALLPAALLLPAFQSLQLYADLPYCPDDRALRWHIHLIPRHYICTYILNIAHMFIRNDSATLMTGSGSVRLLRPVGFLAHPWGANRRCISTLPLDQATTRRRCRITCRNLSGEAVEQWGQQCNSVPTLRTMDGIDCAQ